jgi:hypothetical protein
VETLPADEEFFGKFFSESEFSTIVGLEIASGEWEPNLRAHGMAKFAAIVASF